MTIAAVLAFLARNWRLCLLALLIGFGGAQTYRLHHAKADLVAARAALIDPLTHKTWQSEAVARDRELTTCKGNFDRANAAVTKANGQIDALKQQAEANKVAGKARQSAAQAGSRDAARDAATVMAKKPSGDLCSGAFDVLREK